MSHLRRIGIPPRMNPEFARLAAEAGIVFDGAQDFWPDDLPLRNDELAMDAFPAMLTAPNAGIPALLTTYISPKLIEVLIAPTRAAEIYGEQKIGDWVTDTAGFPYIEGTGRTAAYGDFNQNGTVGINDGWTYRQQFYFQTHTIWGERELARAALAKIDRANRLNLQSVAVMARFRNNAYFYGVAGLQQYGALNDPNLPAAILPATKANGGTQWATATGGYNATPVEVYSDVQALFQRLVTIGQGNVAMDSPITLTMSPAREVSLSNINQFQMTGSEALKKNFPNIQIKTAPQLGGAFNNGIELMQMFVREVEGQETVTCAFSELLRTHALVQDTASWKQKKSGGVWGAVWFRPFLCATMQGI